MLIGEPLLRGELLIVDPSTRAGWKGSCCSKVSCEVTISLYMSSKDDSGPESSGITIGEAIEDADHPCRLASEVFVESAGSWYCDGVTASEMLLKEDSTEVAVGACKSGRDV